MCVCFSHVFLRTDERRSRKRPRLSEVGRVPREFPRLFGKPGLQRHEPGGPRQTERPAGHCQGKLIQSLRVSGARLFFFCIITALIYPYWVQIHTMNGYVAARQCTVKEESWKQGGKSSLLMQRSLLTNVFFFVKMN